MSMAAASMDDERASVSNGIDLGFSLDEVVRRASKDGKKFGSFRRTLAGIYHRITIDERKDALKANKIDIDPSQPTEFSNLEIPQQLGVMEYILENAFERSPWDDVRYRAVSSLVQRAGEPGMTFMEKVRDSPEVARHEAESIAKHARNCGGSIAAIPIGNRTLTEFVPGPTVYELFRAINHRLHEGDQGKLLALRSAVLERVVDELAIAQAFPHTPKDEGEVIRSNLAGENVVIGDYYQTNFKEALLEDVKDEKVREAVGLASGIFTKLVPHEVSVRYHDFYSENFVLRLDPNKGETLDTILEIVDKDAMRKEIENRLTYVDAHNSLKVGHPYEDLLFPLDDPRLNASGIPATYKFTDEQYERLIQRFLLQRERLYSKLRGEEDSVEAAEAALEKLITGRAALKHSELGRAMPTSDHRLSDLLGMYKSTRRRHLVLTKAIPRYTQRQLELCREIKEHINDSYSGKVGLGKYLDRGHWRAGLSSLLFHNDRRDIYSSTEPTYRVADAQTVGFNACFSDPLKVLGLVNTSAYSADRISGFNEDVKVYQKLAKEYISRLIEKTTEERLHSEIKHGRNIENGYSIGEDTEATNGDRIVLYHRGNPIESDEQYLTCLRDLCDRQIDEGKPELVAFTEVLQLKYIQKVMREQFQN